MLHNIIMTNQTKQYEIIEMYKHKIMTNLNDILDDHSCQQHMKITLDHFIETYDLETFNNDFEPVRRTLKKYLDQIKSKTLKCMEIDSYNELLIQNIQRISEQLCIIHNKPKIVIQKLNI